MHSSGKTPLIRLAKRDGMAGAGQWGIRIAAILLALVVGGLVILLSGNNPIQGYAIIVEGALGKTIDEWFSEYLQLFSIRFEKAMFSR